MRCCAIALLCAPSLSAACDDAVADKALDSDSKLLNRCTNLDTKNGCAFRRKPCNPVTCTEVCKDIGAGWSCESSTDFSGKLNGSNPHNMTCGFITRDRGCNDHNPGGCWFSCTCIPPSNTTASLPTAAALVHADIAEFAAWKQEHGKSYATALEEEARLRTYLANRAEVAEHNAGGHGWEMGLNKFADMTDAEWAGVALMAPQECSATARSATRPGARRVDAGDLPKSVDWRDKGKVSAVKDQKSCGSCWTFSTTGAMESHWAIKTGDMVTFAEQQLVDCANAFNNNGCGGGLPSQAFEYIHYAGGIEREADYNYTAKTGKKCLAKKEKFVGTTLGPKNITQNAEDEILDAVANNGPVSIAYDCASDFKKYKKGVYSSTKCSTSQKKVNHAVLVVGYGTTADGVDYWTVKNSWGTSFGIDGYFLIKRGENECGLADCASWPMM